MTRTSRTAFGWLNSHAPRNLVMSALGDRLVLRQTDETGYSDYSVPTVLTKGIELPNGRGIWSNRLIQVAVAGDDASASGQGASIAAVAAGVGGIERTTLATTAPPDSVDVPLLADGPTHAALGRWQVSQVGAAFTGDGTIRRLLRSGTRCAAARARSLARRTGKAGTPSSRAGSNGAENAAPRRLKTSRPGYARRT